MPANNQKKIIAAIISMSMLAFGFVEPVAAQVGLSVGSNSLNLTDPGHNLFYGLTSGSTATGSFMKFQKGAGNTVFQVDYNGNITTTGSFSGNVSGLVNGLDLTNINPNIMENRYSSFESFYDGQSAHVLVAPGVTAAASSDYSIDGNYSYKLTTNSTDGYCVLNSNLTMNVKPSTKYIFSYYAYRASGSVAGTQMYTRENNTAQTYRGCSISAASLGTGKWVRCSTSFTTAADTTRLNLIRADVDSNGTAIETIYFDGIQIEEVSASATLASPYRSPAFNPWVDSLLGAAFSGNVGIGTTSLSTYKLNVAGNFSASNGNVVGDTGGNITFESFTDKSNVLYKLDPSSSANSLNVAGSITALGTSAHNYFAGRVGIRNSSPGAQLEVEIGNSGTETFLLSNSFNNYGLRTGNGGYAGLFGYQQGNDTGSGDSYGTVLSMNAFYNGTSWSTVNGWIRPSFINLGLGGNIIFATQSSSQGGAAGVYTPTEVMRITNAGNVGIGTASPDGALHVYGGASTSKITLSRANVINYKAVLDYSLSSLNFGTASGDGMTFMTNGVTRMTFGSAGNVSIPSGNNFAVDTNTLYVLASSDFVGIGTSSPQAKLAVTGGNIFVHDAAITSLTPKAVITKEYLDSSLSSTTASIITQVSTSSFWQGQLNNDIWANNTLNVGIGTTDPGVKLDVVGGAIRTNNQLISTIANGTAPLSVVSATQVNNLTSQYAGSLRVLSPNAAIDYNTMSYGRTYDYGSGNTRSNGPTGMNYGSVYNFGGGDASQLSLQMAADINHNSTASTRRLWFRTGNNLGFQNDWKEIYHSGNLTNTLSAGYAPKWDGAKFINSVIYDNGTNIGIGTSTSLLGKLHVSGTGYFTNTVTVGTPTAGGHAITRDYLDQTLLNKLTAQSIGTLNVNAIGDIFALYGGSTGSWTNRGPSGHNGGAIFHIFTHPGGYYSDLWFDTANNRVYSRAVNAGTIGGWSLLPKVSASTANYLTKWSSEDSLTRSIIYDNGSSVGIGTTNPGSKLSVAGIGASSTPLTLVQLFNNIPYAVSNGVGGARLELGHGTLHGYIEAGSTGETDSSNGYLALGTRRPINNVTEAMRINSSGNVGIGTTNPQKRLDLGGGTNGRIYGIDTSTSAIFTDSEVVPKKWIVDNFAPAVGGASLWATSSAGTYNVGLGNVGIGTTNPNGYKLYVNGTSYFNGTVSLRNNYNKPLKNYFKQDDTESFINIDDNMTIGEIAEALGRGTVTTGMTKVDDPTAPAPGAFEVSGYQNLDSVGPYWKVDQDSEYIFETWIKVVSSSATTQRFYAGWNMYDANKTSFGNVQRYWGSSGTEYDSNSYNDGEWHHVVARISGVGASTGQFINGTEYAKLVLLFNHSSGDTVTRYAGMKLYKSKKIFTSIYAKNGSVSTVDSDGKLVMDYSGNIFSNNFQASGSGPHYFSAGSVGIGTTNPQKRLDLGGGTNGRIYGIDTSTSAIFTDSEVVPKKWIVDNFAPAVGGASLWATSSAGIYNVGLGNVGIGTTTPANADGWARVLDVYGVSHAKSIVTTNSGIETGTYSHNTGFFGAPAGGIIGTRSNHPLSLITNSASRMTILANGNVGIGTTNPGTYKLNVAGIFSLSNGNVVGDTSGNVTFESFTDKSNVLYKLDPSNTGTSLSVAGSVNVLGTSASNYFAGSVGIGTSSPSQKLTVVSGSPAAPYSGIGLFSGGSSSYTAYTVGRTSVDGYFGVSGGANHYLNGSVAGDVIIDSVSGKVLIGTGSIVGTVGLAVNAGNVGIGTTSTGTYRLNVNGNTKITGGLEVTENGSFSSLNISGKLTVNTIDPLYKIKGVSYSTFAPSFVGGVKEEISGRLRVSEKTGDEYQAVIDFTKQKLGSDLWVWYNVIDFNKDNVEAVITPYGSFANVYYYISGTKIVFKSDRPAEISYRLTGKRFDWRKWPTRADDQTERPSFIID